MHIGEHNVRRCAGYLIASRADGRDRGHELAHFLLHAFDVGLHAADHVGRGDELVVVLVDEDLHVGVQLAGLLLELVAPRHQLVHVVPLQHALHVRVRLEVLAVQVRLVLRARGATAAATRG